MLIEIAERRSIWLRDRFIPGEGHGENKKRNDFVGIGDPEVADLNKAV